MRRSSRKTNLVVFLSDRVEDLRRLIPRALRSSDREAIHFARVTTRRLRSAIDLLQPVLNQDAADDFSAVLKRLRRALGPLRDLDVMSLRLEQYRRKENHAAAARWLTKVLQSRRSELHRKALRKAPVQRVLKELGTWWALEDDILEAEQAEATLIRRVVPQHLESFARRADRVARIRLQEHSQMHEDVHALRIDGKLLRYTLELAIPIGFALPPSVLRSFKRLQDALGLWHDSVVLGEQCLRTALDEALALHDPHLYGQVIGLADRCRRDSNSHLVRFARLWTTHGATLRAAIGTTLKPPQGLTQKTDVGTSGKQSNGARSIQMVNI